MSVTNELAVSFTVHRGDGVNFHNSTVVRDYAGRSRPGKRLFVQGLAKLGSLKNGTHQTIQKKL